MWSGVDPVVFIDDSKRKARRRPFLLFACIASCCLGYAIGHFPTNIYEEKAVAEIESTGPCSDPMKNQGVPTFMERYDLGSIIESENMTVGVELGVMTGSLSKQILERWPSCKEFWMVDVWAHQENYKDSANVDEARQDQNYQETIENTKQWKDKIHICRNYTSVCVKDMADGYFDFIYVDARHDFKGVYEDLQSWWPKLRVGGIFAGHDYVVQNDGPQQGGQDWTTNYDGTKDETGTVVKGAVDKFAAEVCRQVTVSYREMYWNTWAMRK